LRDNLPPELQQILNVGNQANELELLDKAAEQAKKELERRNQEFKDTLNSLTPSWARRG
jgi:hypothetical protein